MEPFGLVAGARPPQLGVGIGVGFGERGFRGKRNHSVSGQQRSCSERGRSSLVESVRKGSHTSYKNRGRKDRQEELFPKLLAEIEERRRNRVAMGMWSGEKRFGGEYKAEMAKLAGDKIGGSEK